MCIAATIAAVGTNTANACTGITLTAKDSTKILARTIEWGGSDLNSQYVIVPQGYTAQSLPKGSTKKGFQQAYSIFHDMVNMRIIMQHIKKKV